VARGALSTDRKKGAHEGRTLVFVDEAGFYLLPAAVATYAPVGETPVLREMLTRDHLSAISAVTPEGRLRMQVYEEAITGAQVVRFLKHLSARLPGGRFWIFWDGAPIHRSRVVKEFLATVPPERFRIEALPGYAPDLNPDEGVWNQLKEDELANVSCLSLRELRAELRAGTQRLQRQPEVVRGFFREAGFG
jgi:transposase